MWVEMGVKNMKTFCNFPEDIIFEEIILRLPVKSLLRLRSTSERWRSFIDSEHFTKKHLQLSAKQSAIVKSGFLNSDGLTQSSGYGVYHCPLQTTSLKDKLALLDDADAAHLNRESGATLGVVGCCNGVVCIFSSEGVCYLWNPSTRISKELPRACVDGKPPASFSLPGFGWDESSNAYKVFALESHHKEGRRISTDLCKVYSSKTNSWRAVEQRRGVNGVSRGGQFARGKLHWQRHASGGGNGEILTLDVKSEKFGVMEPPCGRMPWALGVVVNGLRLHQQQLCAVSCCNPYENREGRLDFWVFNDQGWMKLISAAVAIHDRYPIQFHHEYHIQFNAGQLIFISSGVSEGLMIYDRQPNQATFLPDVHLSLQTLVRF